jgi:hypothetical protein
MPEQLVTSLKAHVLTTRMPAFRILNKFNQLPASSHTLVCRLGSRSKRGRNVRIVSQKRQPVGIRSSKAREASLSCLQGRGCSESRKERQRK